MADPASARGPARATEPEFRDAWRVALAYPLFSVIPAMLAVSLFSAWKGTAIAVETVGIAELFVGHALLASVLAAWFFLQQRDGWREFLSLPRGGWPRRIWSGMRLGFFAWIATVASMAVLTTVADLADAEPQEGFTKVVAWLATRPFPLRILLISSAMWVEEAFFRAFLQPRVGVLAATVAFALSHLSYGSPAMGGGVFVVGLILAIAFRRSGDLAVVAIAHGVFDAIQLLVILPIIASRL